MGADGFRPLVLCPPSGLMQHADDLVVPNVLWKSFARHRQLTSVLMHPVAGSQFSLNSLVSGLDGND